LLARTAVPLHGVAGAQRVLELLHHGPKRAGQPLVLAGVVNLVQDGYQGFDHLFHTTAAFGLGFGARTLDEGVEPLVEVVQICRGAGELILQISGLGLGCRDRVFRRRRLLARSTLTWGGAHGRGGSAVGTLVGECRLLGDILRAHLAGLGVEAPLIADHGLLLRFGHFLSSSSTISASTMSSSSLLELSEPSEAGASCPAAPSAPAACSWE